MRTLGCSDECVGTVVSTPGSLDVVVTLLTRRGLFRSLRTPKPEEPVNGSQTKKI